MKVIFSIAFTEIQFGTLLIHNLKYYGVDRLYDIRKTLEMT